MPFAAAMRSASDSACTAAARCAIAPASDAACSSGAWRCRRQYWLLAPATHGLSLLLAGGYAVLGQRIARYRRAQGDSGADARLYARFVVIGKFAEAWGLLKFYLNNMAGRFRIIEYK